VVKRPRDGHKFFNTQHCGLSSGAWLKWRSGGATRGKGRQLDGKVGEWVCGEPTPPRFVAPARVD
jgi:hypothetical protein